VRVLVEASNGESRRSPNVKGSEIAVGREWKSE
jgi:hypothetical protein